MELAIEAICSSGVAVAGESTGCFSESVSPERDVVSLVDFSMNCANCGNRMR